MNDKQFAHVLAWTAMGWFAGNGWWGGAVIGLAMALFVVALGKTLH